jgi:hypothetical protein
VNHHSTTTTSGGVDGPDLAAIAALYVFAIHLALGLWAVGAAPSRFGGGGGGGEGDRRGDDGTDAGSSSSSRERRRRRDDDDGRARTTAPSSRRRCAICPREGQNMSCLLVFLPEIAQSVAFCGMDGSAMVRIIDECWRRLLP